MKIDKNKIITSQPVPVKEGGCGLFSLVLIILSLLIGSFTFAQQYYYVDRVVDGDTFVANKTYYRLADIDAPESTQLYGKESTKYLKDLIEGRKVKIYVTSNDRYHRKIAKVYINNEYVSNILVSNGYAWWYEKYSNDYKLRKLECYAKRNKKGLWQKPAIAPWLYRKYK